MIQFAKDCPSCGCMWPISCFRWYRRRCSMCASFGIDVSQALYITYRNVLATFATAGRTRMSGKKSGNMARAE